MPEVILAIEDQDLVAPPELVQIMMALHTQLKKRKAEYSFMNYTTYHVEGEGWRDNFEVS